MERERERERERKEIFTNFIYVSEKKYFTKVMRKRMNDRYIDIAER